MPWDPRIQALVDRFPALRAVGNTPLVPVDIFRKELPEVEVFSKMESLNPGGSLKDRPVLRMLLGAVDDGRLKPGRIVLDSSSGNAGIAYSMIGRIIGVPVAIVIPDNASAERKKRMLAHGAQLIFTDALLGYDEALREVRRRFEAEPERYFFCDQYSNGDNWRAHYETTAEEILQQTGGKLTHVVFGVGGRSTIPRSVSSASSPRRFPASRGSSRWGALRTSCRRSWTRRSSTSACPSPSMRRTRCACGSPRRASSSASPRAPTWLASCGWPGASAAADS